MKKTLLAAAVSFTMGMSLTAIASNEIPDLIQDMRERGGELHEVFKVSDYLIGYAMSLGSDQIIVYATPDGQHLFSGDLVNNRAQNLTEIYAQQYLPQPDFSAVIPEFEEASWIETHDSDAEKTLYVIHDPRCPYCKQAFELIMQNEHRDGVKVRWLPVAALGQESVVQSSALLAAENPIQLQRDLDNGYELSRQERDSATKHRDDVMRNSQLMRKIEASGTPAFMVVNESTQEVENIVHGFRPNVINQLW